MQTHNIVKGTDIAKALRLIKGELQRQNKLISSERPSKILPNETKIVKIRQAVLEILTLKIYSRTVFREKTTEKPKMLINNPEYLHLWTEYEPKFLWVHSLTHLEYDCHIFVVTMVTILEQKHYT